MSDCYGWTPLYSSRPNNGAAVVLAFPKKSGGWYYKLINHWEFELNLKYRPQAYKIFYKYVGHGPDWYAKRESNADE